MMTRVILETPYAGNVEENLAYARRCMADCLRRGESPFASHLLYTQPLVLDDANPEERRAGINAGFAWRGVADMTVVYTDHGISRGMLAGIQHTESIGHRIDYRRLSDVDKKQAPEGKRWVAHGGVNAKHLDDIPLVQHVCLQLVDEKCNEWLGRIRCNCK